MNLKLPQPFNQEQIRKDPKAVVIALLIGLLLLNASVITYLYDQGEKKERKIDQINEKWLAEKRERITMYEKMLFYKNENIRKKESDSLIKQRTEPLVKKILQ